MQIAYNTEYKALRIGWTVYVCVAIKTYGCIVDTVDFLKITLGK